MGLPVQFAGAVREAHEVRLEPGDRVLFYTDGVTEARVEGGEEFGLDGFTNSIIRGSAAA